MSSPAAASGVVRPVPDEVSEFFWEGARQGELRIQRCGGCAKFIHWPRPICRYCGSTELTPQVVSGSGALYSFTIVEKAFHPFFADRVPYVVATVELIEQRRLMMVSNLVDVEESSIRIGMPLRADFRDVGGGLVLPRFAPDHTAAPR